MSRPINHDRRPELLEEIVDYLGRNGVAQLTLRNLAAGLGVSTTTLVYHFGSKRQLIDAAVDLAERRMRDVTRDALSEGVGPALRAFWAWGAQPENLAQIAFAIEVAAIDLSSAGGRRAKRPSEIAQWIEMFEVDFVNRGLDPKRANRAATLIHAAVLGLCMDLWDSGDVERTSEALDSLAAYADFIVLDSEDPTPELMLR